MGVRNNLLAGLDALATAVKAEVTELIRAQNSRLRAVNLPVEILARIFEEACFAFVVPGTRLSVAYGPQLWHIRNAISSTCYCWRQIAHTDSMLWTNIVNRRWNKQAKERVSFEIERSNGRLLTLHISDLHFDIVKDIIDIPRCEGIHWKHHHDFGWPAYFDAASPPLPFLRTLAIEFVSCAPATEMEIYLGQHVALERLSIQSYNVPHRYSLRLPVASGIRKLSLCSTINPHDVIHAIRSCPSLETLVWEHASHTALVQLPALPPLTNLRELSLRGHLPATYLREIGAPGLIRLQVIPKLDRDEDWTPNIFPDPSQFPNLQHVEFTKLALLSSRNIAAFLHAHPMLEEVMLQGTLNELLVESLGAQFTSKNSPLPKLKIIWLSTTNRHPPHLLNIKQLLRSRRQCGDDTFTLRIHVDEECYETFTNDKEFMDVTSHPPGPVQLEIVRSAPHDARHASPFEGSNIFWEWAHFVQP